MDDLKTQVAAWNRKRNDLARPVDWQFTNAKARIKLKRRYTEIQN